MSQTLEFYLARADESAQEAACATLDNVRDRALRSEAAWRQMAARVMHIEGQRRASEQQKSERTDAERVAEQPVQIVLA